MGQLEESSMFVNTCPFCSHGNQATARFCSACGGALHLVPCPRCGAGRDGTATTCYQCKSQLRGRRMAQNDDMLPVAEETKAPPRSYARAIAVTAALVTIVALAYFGYRQGFPVKAPPQPTAVGEPSDRGGAGVIRKDVEASDGVPAKTEDAVQAASPAAPPPETPVARPAATAPAARSQPAAKVRERAAPRPIVCTASVAALGLCSQESVQKPEPETAAATKAPAAAAQPSPAQAAAGQEPPRQAACTQAVAALGLCTPGPTQGRQ